MGGVTAINGDQPAKPLTAEVAVQAEIVAPEPIVPEVDTQFEVKVTLLSFYIYNLIDKGTRRSFSIQKY